ncbi:hypothetical protein M8C21_004245, partial [Ambrosia artemisiifolia]
MLNSDSLRKGNENRDSESSVCVEGVERERYERR